MNKFNVFLRLLLRSASGRGRVPSLERHHMKLSMGYVLLSFTIITSWAENARAVEPGPDVIGWRQAQWGMTEEEVIAAFQGEAKAQKEARHLGGTEKLPDSWTMYSNVQIDSVSISTGTFRAEFFFDRISKKLIEVMLSSRTDDHPNLSTLYDDLEKMLTEKYGTPTYNNTTVSPKNPIAKTVTKVNSWKLTKTLIELKYLDIEMYGERFFAQITVVYTSAMVHRKGEDKL